MTDDTDRLLFGFFNRLRSSGRRPELKDLAKEGKDAGLSLAEFSRFSRSFPIGNRPISASEVDGFILGLALDPSCLSILEVGEDGAIFCAPIIESRADVNVTYVTRLSEIVEAIEVFVAPSRWTFFNKGADIDPTMRFDLIIVHVPWGKRRAGERSADGFGGEMVRDLLPLLADDGRLVWVTSRAALRNAEAAANRNEWRRQGYSILASIDLPGGWMMTSPTVEGVAIVFNREGGGRKLLGVLREDGSGSRAAASLLKGPTRKAMVDGLWIEANDERFYSDIEHRRSVEKLIPKGRFARAPLRTLVVGKVWEKADRPFAEGEEACVFVPEYASGTVTIRLEDQTVAPKAVRRIALNSSKVNPAFLARILNSPLGKSMRRAASSGAGIQRIVIGLLMEMPVPLPDLKTQDRIVRLDADMATVNATIAERLRSLDEDWRRLDEIAEDVEAMKGVFDLDRRIDEWWQELPYPLATIYRRHRFSTDPKERFETILHFFEVFAVFLSSMGVSHVRALRGDASELLAKLAYPERASSIDRADFGFWIRLAAGSFKELKRTVGDSTRRIAASDFAGPTLVGVVESMMSVADAATLLDRPREMRNALQGHGGFLKSADAERANEELQTVLRELFAASAATLRKARLVRIGQCRIRGEMNVYEAELLQGSDPTFARKSIECRSRVDSGTLAFWHAEVDEIVGRAPFFRLGAPQDPRESTMYVYSRVEAEGLRWISYQETRDQAIVVADDALGDLIRATP